MGEGVHLALALLLLDAVASIASVSVDQIEFHNAEWPGGWCGAFGGHRSARCKFRPAEEALHLDSGGSLCASSIMHKVSPLMFMVPLHQMIDAQNLGSEYLLALGAHEAMIMDTHRLPWRRKPSCGEAGRRGGRLPCGHCMSTW